jgi:thioredoxin-dependent peroxiredoxin
VQHSHLTASHLTASHLTASHMRPLFLSMIAAAIFCGSTFAENPLVSLEQGDLAPKLSAVDDTGRIWKSSDHVGKNIVVVFFYPADLTTGCTTQACGFQRHLAELKTAGADVVGVSGDSVTNHQLFKKTCSLSFPLLADEDGKVAGAFGVPIRGGGNITRVVQGQQKRLTRGVTAQRWTFVIGLDGTIIHKDTAVDAAKDGQSVLKVVRQLTVSTQ